jgi:hypothetical protein
MRSLTLAISIGKTMIYQWAWVPLFSDKAQLSLLAIKQLVPWLNSLPQGLKEVQVVQVQDMKTPKVDSLKRMD